MKKILVINGPNMDMLGSREPDKYGNDSLKEINEKISLSASEYHIDVDFFQSNIEGEIINKIHGADGVYNGVIINPAAYSHTSVAIRDAISSVNVPFIEVHMTNITGRETFRQISLTAPVCIGQICGFGADSYLLALSEFVSGR